MCLCTSILGRGTRLCFIFQVECAEREEICQNAESVAEGQHPEHGGRQDHAGMEEHFLASNFAFAAAIAAVCLALDLSITVTD